MRRLARPLLNALTVTSAACLVVAGLALALAPVTPPLVIRLDPARWNGRSVVIQDGEIGLTHVASRDPNGRAWTSSTGQWVSYLSIIECSVLLPLATVVLWQVDALRQWRASRRKGCRSCGYDLTGNVSGVCPECGTAILKSATDFSN